MPTITINPSGKTIAAAAESSLLQALLAAGESVAHKCEGKAECGKCHIFVHEGRKTVSKIQREENAKLDSIIGVSSKSRLACMVMLGTEDVTVELPGFGSGF
jgi:2Fe-2S ferredoxin